MGLKGQFTWIKSLRQGGRKAISFTLSCTNLFQSETFNAAILDGTGGLQPMHFTQQNLPAKKSLRFDFDTVGWDWCQGDKFVILDKKGNIKDEWVVNMKTYSYGECPSCHGSHKCTQCSGTGRITDRRTHMVEYCQVCAGTGQCQVCFLPTRGIASMGQTTYNMQSSVTPESSRQRRIADINARILELNSKVEKIEWDLRIMNMKGQSYRSYSTYSSILSLKFTYEQQIIKLQSELRQLEQMNF